MNHLKRIVLLSFLFWSEFVFAQNGCDSVKALNDLERPDSVWEAGFQSRLKTMWGGWINTSSYDPNPNCGSEDCGKGAWPPFLARLAYNRNQCSTLVTGLGRAMLNGQYTGSFYKPFSCDGYSLYYFKYKDSISKYDPQQLGIVENELYNPNDGFRFLMRKDRLLDACCSYNASGGKEFNSENFQWLLRTTGYLFAHEFNQRNGHNNQSLSLYIDNYDTSTYTYSAQSMSHVNLVSYFDGYAKNLTRALYNTGRIEWNSNNYWGYTFNPLVSWYEGAENCHDTLGGQPMKQRAKACLDWMMLEAAVHYVDGLQIAADSRAKTNFFLPFAGSIFPASIPFFTDDQHPTSFPSNIFQTQDPSVSIVGSMFNTTYRPGKIIIDIAQRNFPLPVEIQSAKPFYNADFGDFFGKGEFPYAQWKGNNGTNSRRFEFETIYIDENFTLSSVASGRPNGNLGTFSEQATWQLGVKGVGFGAQTFAGNSWNFPAADGRSPYEEIGQFRTMLLRLVKAPYSNGAWSLIPDPDNELTAGGSGSWFDWSTGYKVCFNMGNDVYVGFNPYQATSATVDTTQGTTNSPYHSQIYWNFNNDTLGAVAMEIGTKQQYGSYQAFKTAFFASTFTDPATDVLQFNGAAGHNIKMQFTPVASYLMANHTADTPYPNPYAPAGNYPMVWGDGQYMNFQTWDSYKTVMGFPVINQQWGSGKMVLNTNGRHAVITVDSTTALANYQYTDSLIFSDSVNFTIIPSGCGSANNYKLINTTTSSSVTPEWDINNDGTYDLTGDTVCCQVPAGQTWVINMRIRQSPYCYARTKTVTNNGIALSLQSKKEEDDVTVYPNPFGPYIAISGKNIVTTTLYGADGRKVLAKEANPGNAYSELNTQWLPAGFYLVELTLSDGSVLRRKIIKYGL